MTDLREFALKKKIAAKQLELDITELPPYEVDKIKEEVSKIILAKLDDTKDYEGCLYSENWKVVID
jgi:hypothetical protein